LTSCLLISISTARASGGFAIHYCGCVFHSERRFTLRDIRHGGRWRLRFSRSGGLGCGWLFLCVLRWRFFRALFGGLGSYPGDFGADFFARALAGLLFLFVRNVADHLVGVDVEANAARVAHGRVQGAKDEFSAAQVDRAPHEGR